MSKTQPCAACGCALPVRESGSGRQRTWCEDCMRERCRTRKAGLPVSTVPVAPKPRRVRQATQNERLAAIRAERTARQRACAYGVPV